MSRLTVERRRALLDELRSPDLSASKEDELLSRYLEGLPRPEISRCPFTRAVVERTMDTFGLDGPWWDVDAAVRVREPRPDSLWALSGAMALAIDALETTDFLVKPGPGVPFVVEHLIRHPAVRAVVSTVAIGAHTGYAVCYFADEGPQHLARVNEWGSSQYWYQDVGGWWADSVTEGEQEELFDLAPWIADGKLLWIAPGDRSLTLRSEVADCPYVGLSGPHEHQRVQGGRAWTPSSVLSLPEPPPD